MHTLPACIHSPAICGLDFCRLYLESKENAALCSLLSLCTTCQPAPECSSLSHDPSQSPSTLRLLAFGTGTILDALWDASHLSPLDTNRTQFPPNSQKCSQGTAKCPLGTRPCLMSLLPYGDISLCPQSLWVNYRGL